MARSSSGARWAAALVVPGLALLAAVATLAFDRNKGIVPLLELNDQVRSTESQILALGAERDELIRHVRGLRMDSYEVEVVAREKLGMVRPGELVIRLEEPVPDPD